MGFRSFGGAQFQKTMVLQVIVLHLETDYQKKGVFNASVRKIEELVNQKLNSSIFEVT